MSWLNFIAAIFYRSFIRRMNLFMSRTANLRGEKKDF